MKRLSFLSLFVLLLTTLFSTPTPVTLAAPETCGFRDGTVEKMILNDMYGEEAIVLEENTSISITGLIDLSNGRCKIGTYSVHKSRSNPFSLVTDHWITYFIIDSSQGYVLYGPYLNIGAQLRRWVGGTFDNESATIYYVDVQSGAYTAGAFQMSRNFQTIEAIPVTEIPPEFRRTVTCLDLTDYELIAKTKFSDTPTNFYVYLPEDMSGGLCSYGFIQVFAEGPHTKSMVDADWWKGETFFFFNNGNGVTISESVKRDDGWFFFPARMTRNEDALVFQVYSAMSDMETITINAAGQITSHETMSIPYLESAVYAQNKSVPQLPNYIDTIVRYPLPENIEILNFPSWRCFNVNCTFASLTFVSPNNEWLIYFAIRTQQGWMYKEPLLVTSYIFYETMVYHTESGYVIEGCVFDGNIYKFDIPFYGEASYSKSPSTNECELRDAFPS